MKQLYLFNQNLSSFIPLYRGLFVVCIVLFTLQVSAQCTQLLVNSPLTANRFAVPMHPGYVPGWQVVHRTPGPPIISDTIEPCAYSSPPNGILLMSNTFRPTNSAPFQRDGNAIGQKINNLVVGRQYVFSFRANKLNPALGQFHSGYVKAFLRHQSNSVNTVPANGWTQTAQYPNMFGGPNQFIAQVQPIYRADSCPPFVQVQVCFTATSDWDFLVIYPEADLPTGQFNNQNHQLVTRVDDIELYEIKPDAGNDTAICKGSCVNLGKSCMLNVLGIQQSFKWYELGNSSVLATTPTITVCPTVSKSYVIERIIDSSCVDYDTVHVSVDDSINFSLGADTTACGGCFWLYGPSPPGGISYRYLWNTGDTTQNIRVCHSGVYVLEVISPGGCKKIDSIKVTIRPEIKIDPPDTTVCVNAFPITLSVKAGFQSYTWSTGSNTHSTIITGAGTYWVTVTDSGCTKTDSVTVNVLPSDLVDLGPDDTICEGSSKTICGPNGPFQYLWNTNSTSRCISVQAAGTYILKVFTADSCVDYDTINLYLRPKPTPSIDMIGPFCYDDDSVQLSATPLGGIFTGNGVIGNYFYPSLAGEGLHSITYAVTDSFGCVGSDSILVRVHRAVDAYINEFGPFCENDAPYQVTATKPGGVFSGLDPGDLFDPASKGPGVHLVTYQYTDSNGCVFIDSFYALVNAKPAIVIIADTANRLCAQKPLSLLASPIGAGQFSHWIYTWAHNGSHDNPITVFGNGTYEVTVLDDSTGCSATATFEVNLPDCCDGENTIGGELEIIAFEHWDHTTHYVDDDIIVKKDAILRITNSEIYMRNCSKILVEQGGQLFIEDSHVGMCNWQGIEVWGYYDVCQTTDINDPYQNLVSHQGFAHIENSVISNAEFGVMAGRIGNDTDPNSLTYGWDRRLWGGGVLYIHNDTFINNYVDIIFQEYNAHTLMAAYQTLRPATCVHPYNISSVENNWFMDMKADNCGVFVDAYLTEYAFSQCHILSSSDNLAIWSIPINMPIPLNWPPPDYLKGQHYMVAYNVLPPFIIPPPYTCIPCRIQNNFYANNCHIIHNLK